jgi:hypothetical protein
MAPPEPASANVFAPLGTLEDVVPASVPAASGRDPHATAHAHPGESAHAIDGRSAPESCC